MGLSDLRKKLLPRRPVIVAHRARDHLAEEHHIEIPFALLRSAPTMAASRFPKNHPILSNFVVLLIGLLLLVLYATYDVHRPDPSVSFWGMTVGGASLHGLAILSREIGFALIVAVALNISIEAFNRKRHESEKTELLNALSNAHEQQRIQLVRSLDLKHKDHLEAVNARIFQVVYQRNVPESIFKEVENQLLRCPFIRHKSEFTYVIRKLDDQHVVLDVRHVYVVENIAPTKENYDLSISFDVIRSLSSQYTIRTIRHDGHVLTNIQPEITSKSDIHDLWRVGASIPMDPGQKIECEIDYRRVSPLIGKEVICTLLPVKELTVRVVDPKAEFAFRAMALHPRPEKNKSSTSNPYEWIWQIDGALFPGQGMLFDWLPREPSEGATVPAVAATDVDK